MGMQQTDLPTHQEYGLDRGPTMHDYGEPLDVNPANVSTVEDYKDGIRMFEPRRLPPSSMARATNTNRGEI